MSQKHKNQNIQSCFVYKNGCYLLFNPQLLHSPEAGLLCRGLLEKTDKHQPVTSGGRGQAWFVEIGGISAVYRKYMRGGLMSRVNRQAYLGLRLENTRSVKEWRLLQWMVDYGLPVPSPVAASVCRWPFSFSPFYQSQILVERIPDVQTLDLLLSQQSIENRVWQSVGQCIRRFHNAGIYHADLNANNILLDSEFRVYLIDFDKGELRESGQSNAVWMQGNLQRLKRSLLKQREIHPSYHFTEENWQTLMAAYAK